MYGILIAFSLVFALLLAEKMLPSNLKKDDFWAVSLLVFVFSLIGARAYHVLDYWYYYSQDVTKTIFLNQGGLGIFGALIAGFLVLFFYCKWKNLPFWIFLDLFLFWSPFIQVFGRLGNWFNKELFGLPTNFFIKVFIPLEKRPVEYKNFAYYHPLFFYEAFLNFLIFILFVFLYRRKKIPLGSKIYTSLYLILYGSFRLVLEPLRLSQDTFALGPLRVSYFLSSGFILLGLLLLTKSRKFFLKTNELR